MSQQTDIPTNADLITSAFEGLSTAEKMEVFWNIVSSLDQDLKRFNDPVLGRELDILDGITSNIDGRLEEIAAIHGVR
jgi:hypothetical protein